MMTLLSKLLIFFPAPRNEAQQYTHQTERTIGTYLARYQQRKQLARLSARQLEDMGITREQVQKECAKPFWQK